MIFGHFSQYPSVLMNPSCGPFDDVADYCKIPVGKKKVILNDEEARQQCTPTCEHKCDPTCAPELPEKCLHKIDQSSSNCNLCLPMCPKLLKATRFCRRQDDHDCNDSCQKSCSRHFSPLDYNNAPCIVNCVVLPPQNIRYEKTSGPLFFSKRQFELL